MMGHNGKELKFVLNKFALSYEDEINHFQNNDGYDLFVPIKNNNK